MRRAKFPSGVPVFEDVDPFYAGDVYEAVDLKLDCCGNVIGLVVIEHGKDGHTVSSGDNYWIGLEWLRPLNRDGEAMLAIARSRR